MKLNDIVRFLRELGTGEINVSDDDSWVRCKCPLAPVFHAKGTDENPSFGIAVNDGGESGFHCFTCKSGRLGDLIHILNFTTGIRKSACDFYGLNEIWDSEKEERSCLLTKSDYYRDIFNIDKEEKIERIPIPDHILERYPILYESTHKKQVEKCYTYFENRGISREVVDLFKVRHDPWKGLIAFPIYGDSRNIFALHFKPPVDDRGKFRFWHLTPKNSGYPEEKWGSPDAMFGLQFYSSKLPLIFVESETDVLRLFTLGLNDRFCIIGACGAVNEVKIKRFRNSTAILGFDSDAAGSKYYKKSLELFPKHVALSKLEWSIAGIEDAGELESAEDFWKIYDCRRVVGSAIFSPNFKYEDLWI